MCCCMTAPPLADLGPARGQRESAGWCEAADWRVTVSAASPVTQRGRPLASRHTDSRPRCNVIRDCDRDQVRDQETDRHRYIGRGQYQRTANTHQCQGVPCDINHSSRVAQHKSTGKYFLVSELNRKYFSSNFLECLERSGCPVVADPVLAPSVHNQ